jgi:hypothetical protein
MRSTSIATYSSRDCSIRDAVLAQPGAPERLAGLRAETLEEIRLYELRHGEAISQVELNRSGPSLERPLRESAESSGVVDG